MSRFAVIRSERLFRIVGKNDVIAIAEHASKMSQLGNCEVFEGVRFIGVHESVQILYVIGGLGSVVPMDALKNSCKLRFENTLFGTGCFQQSYAM